jgi:hypothetical protein
MSDITRGWGDRGGGGGGGGCQKAPKMYLVIFGWRAPNGIRSSTEVVLTFY